MDHAVNERKFTASGRSCAAKSRLFAARWKEHAAKCVSGIKPCMAFAVQTEAGERMSVYLAANGVLHMAEQMPFVAHGMTGTANGMADAAICVADAANDVSCAAYGAPFTARFVFFAASGVPGDLPGGAWVRPASMVGVVAVLVESLVDGELADQQPAARDRLGAVGVDVLDVRLLAFQVENDGVEGEAVWVVARSQWMLFFSSEIDE